MPPAAPGRRTTCRDVRRRERSRANASHLARSGIVTLLMNRHDELPHIGSVRAAKWGVLVVVGCWSARLRQQRESWDVPRSDDGEVAAVEGGYFGDA